MPPLARSTQTAGSSDRVRVTAAVTWGLLAFACLLAAPQVGAQPKELSKERPKVGAPVPAVEQGARWQDLNAGQRSTLRPLERDWAGISANQKQKWLEIAARFPNLKADEKARIQARMTEWAQLTTEQRQEARVNYQQAKRVAPQDRRSQWETYQSLPPEEKSKLAARATPQAADGGAKGERLGLSAQPSKSNIVPNPAFSAPPKAVAPTVQQAQPGATTTLISKRPVPPAHQQTGMPKISAGPNFVDKQTLLPQRGPQGAATTRSAAASGAEAAQRR